MQGAQFRKDLSTVARLYGWIFNLRESSWGEIAEFLVTISP